MVQRVQRITWLYFEISFRFSKITTFCQDKKKEKSVAWEINRIHIFSVSLLLYFSLIADCRAGLLVEPNFAFEAQADFT